MLNRSEATQVYLGIGSNLGDRLENVRLAISLLSERLKIGKTSPVYDTEPVGETHQPRFLNIVVQASTRLPPSGLLFMLKGIEAKLGRVPVDTPRPIDIDILFYGEQVISELPQLVVPHPRLSERAFVLIPLTDIAPEFVHPVSKKSIKSLLKEVRGKEGVVRYSEQLEDKLDGKKEQ